MTKPSCDINTCRRGARNRDFYSEPWHQLFSVNHLYRMAAELPMHGFDPDGFECNPVWYPQCSLVAHTVRATRDQNFAMGSNGEIKIPVRKGDVFHCDNSFKYRPAFFEDCVRQIGLGVIKRWSDENGLFLYLLHVPPRSVLAARQEVVSARLREAA